MKCHVSLEKTLDEPDPAENDGREVVLSYHDEPLHRAAGEHAELIAEGLRDLIPKISRTPQLIHEGLDKSEREDIKAKQLPIEVGETQYNLSVYPDAVVYDTDKQLLYFLEAVTSRGPFTDRRIETLLNDLSQPYQGIDGWSDPDPAVDRIDVVFITMFPDVGRFRKHLMDIGSQSYVWISDHPSTLRAFTRTDITTENITMKHQHTIEF